MTTSAPDPNVDLVGRRVFTGHHWVEFRSRETWDLFMFLLANRTHVVSRPQMIAHLWPDPEGRGKSPDARLSQRITLLHGYLRGSPRWRLVTHHGRGIQLADDWKLASDWER